ncbi:jg17444 [Pararge aegeria aegeria]|uniref:Jg17444 protein n=1 Tax=Pararge aegeria aegeria TaxID=348720 RepID=A0A8S4S4S6_9NEOP|nr:jg17444 [Pararge aegeria aegeria]
MHDKNVRKRLLSMAGQASQTVAKPGLTRNKMLLCVWWDWKGYEGIIANEKADELAKTGALEKQIGPEPFCELPKCMAQLTLQTYCNYHTLIRWRQLPGMNHSRVLI